MVKNPTNDGAIRVTTWTLRFARHTLLRSGELLGFLAFEIVGNMGDEETNTVSYLW